LLRARDNLEGYDPKKYNVNVRIQGFKDKIKEKYDNIYENKNKITHISSVGDPYIMFNQQQQRRRLGTTQSRSRPIKEDFIYNPYDPQNHKKELKNSIRVKAEQK
jgi:N12 class adenine-specific DNA methylase